MKLDFDPGGIWGINWIAQLLRMARSLFWPKVKEGQTWEMRNDEGEVTATARILAVTRWRVTYTWDIPYCENRSCSVWQFRMMYDLRSRKL
jgi:hypothetical protein